MNGDSSVKKYEVAITLIFIPAICAVYPLIFESANKELTGKIAVGLFVLLLMALMLCLILVFQCSKLSADIHKERTYAEIAKKVSESVSIISDSSFKQSEFERDRLRLAYKELEASIDELYAKVDKLSKEKADDKADSQSK